MSSPIQYFLFLSLLFGSIYTFLIPPFQAPDEAHHFYRAYHVSEGYWMGEKTTDQRFGGELPQSLHELAQTFRYLRYDKSAKVDEAIWQQAQQLELNAASTTFVDFPNVAYYLPIPYLPQAAMLWVGKKMKLKPLYLLYLARLANLLVWVVLVACAIQLLPFHQRTVTTLALLPASLVFHAGINADAVTNAFCFLLTAYLLRLSFSNKDLRGQHLWLVLLSAIITLSKVVYAPIFLLAWLIPVHKWKSKMLFIGINIGLLVFHALLLLWWSDVAGDLFIPYDDYHPDFRVDKQLNPGVDPMAQLSFILEKPLQFLSILFSSYVEIFPYTLLHYFGKFGWEGNYMPLWSIAGLGLTTVSVAVLEKPIPLEGFAWKRWILVAVGLIMMLAFSVVIYMQWNAPRDPQITALSGRYFIPIFPFFFLALANRKWRVSFNWRIGWMSVLFLAQLVMCWSIWGRHYG
jgi:uncharacterized membrane protein